MPTLAKKFDSFSELLAKLLIPHSKNDHHPWLIRHEALFLLTAAIVGVQFFYNLQVSSVKVLGYATSIYQNQIISLTNQERISNGAPGLSENRLLDQAAADKAANMFAENYWAHYAPDGTSPWYWFGLVGYKYIFAGENLARDFQTSDGVVQGWMASPGHRANLLNPSYTEIGVAVANGTLQGEETTLVVQLFGTPEQTAVAPVQAAPPANPKPISDALVVEKTKGSSSSATAAASPITKVSQPFSGSFNLVQNLVDLPGGARWELFLLLGVFLVFVFDSVVLFRRRIQRPASHSLVHAIVIFILIVSVVVSFKGKLI